MQPSRPHRQRARPSRPTWMRSPATRPKPGCHSRPKDCDEALRRAHRHWPALTMEYWRIPGLKGETWGTPSCSKTGHLFDVLGIAVALDLDFRRGFVDLAK